LNWTTQYLPRLKTLIFVISNISDYPITYRQRQRGTGDKIQKKWVSKYKCDKAIRKEITMSNRMEDDDLLEMFVNCEDTETLRFLAKALISEKYYEQYTQLVAMCVDQVREGVMELTLDLMRFMYPEERENVPMSYVFNHNILWKQVGEY